MAAFRALLWFLRQDGSLVATMTKFVGLLAVVGILFWVVFVCVPLTFSQGSWVDGLPSESWAQTWWNTAGFTSGWLSRVFFGKSTEHVWQLEFQSSTAESCDLALQSPNQSLAGGSFVFVFKSPMIKVFQMDWNQSDRYDRKHNCFLMSQEPKPKDEEQDPAVPFTQMSTSAGERMDLWSKRYQSTLCTFDNFWVFWFLPFWFFSVLRVNGQILWFSPMEDLSMNNGDVSNPIWVFDIFSHLKHAFFCKEHLDKLATFWCDTRHSRVLTLAMSQSINFTAQKKELWDWRSFV